ncbi:hypothetical protein ONA70_17770 [Micromonospora yasonensis]|uniref:LamG-like jellyroll fold domain-containing protein n=1 Tax=Micromonospora yasonensis TaxID=1128667 RepID=UPI002230A66D|nr:LamG-like jellyroll fold domain-containing protein [Micromonospora yasonensis]MCW3841950.1 hypothetical protein [Micromonospora yasonensis]
MERPTEQSAAALARSTGQRIEVTGLRTETQQVFANPSGTFTLTQSARPQRVRRGDTWVPVDTTLQRHADGMVVPAATEVHLEFSGGGTAPLVRMLAEGRGLEIGWARSLPSPTLDGDTATYPEVLPGVDLVVRADVDGFSQVLVVKSAEAAHNPELRTLRYTTRGHGVATQVDAAGNLQLVAPDGRVVFHGGTPLMWDSSGDDQLAARERITGPGHNARHRAMRLRGTAHELTVEPDLAMLSASDTTFPVYLDPNIKWAGGRLAWTSVWKAYPNSSYFNSTDIARVGHENQTGMTNRSFFRMDSHSIKGKTIINGTFRTYETHSWSCSARQVEVWWTGAIGSGTTWNTQPGWNTKLATVNVAKGYSSSCPAGGVDFNVKSIVVNAAAGGWNDITLGLRASSETDTYAWKKFRNNPTLEVEYNTPPDLPTSLSLDPGLPCVTGASRPVIGTTTATMRAKITDKDPQSVGARFQLYTLDGVTLVGEYATPKVASGSVHSYAKGSLANGGLYKWRVRGEDTGTAGNLGPWTGYCEFAVDLSPPASTPTVTSTTYPETLAGSDPVYGGSPGLPGSFTFAAAAADTDVVAFEWGLNTQPPANRVNATTKGGSATLDITPTTDLLNTLYVRSVDAAGNKGLVYGYQFYVRPVTIPVGAWELDEASGSMAADSSDGGHPATLAGGATHVSGRVGTGSVRLDGTTGYAATSAAVLRTDLSFTVSAWVRPTSLSRNVTAVGQDGTANSSFRLGNWASTNTWTMAMVTADSSTTGTHISANSTAAPKLNVWTQLTGVYDKSAGQLRLYVDGVLNGSVAYTGAWNATGPLSIGRAKYHGAMADWFAGDVDDVRVYQGVLSDDTIREFAAAPPALVGNWKLDETGGTVAADASGAGRTATLTGGASWTAGRVGGALRTDGSTGYASAGGPVLRTDQSFTVGAWVRVRSGYPTSVPLTAVSQDGAAISGFVLQFEPSDNTWSFGLAGSDSSTDGYDEAVAFHTPVPDTWTHLTGVYDADTGQLRVYVDGELSGVGSHTTPWHAAAGLQIGRARSGTSLTGFWPGEVDDVRVYQGVVDDATISAWASA